MVNTASLLCSFKLVVLCSHSSNNIVLSTELLSIEKPTFTIDRRHHHYSFPHISHNHVPFIRQVCFIPNKHDNDITSSLRSNVINPLWGLLEWIKICEQKKKKIPEKWQEASLACSPQRHNTCCILAIVKNLHKQVLLLIQKVEHAVTLVSKHIKKRSLKNENINYIENPLRRS